jgi:hypothetical protein
MMRSWGCVAMAAMATAVMACSMFKKPGAGDAGEDGSSEASAAAASAEPAPVLAVNESEITRYPDEKPVARAPLTTDELVGNVRTQAGAGGDLVVILKKGTEVDKLAERGGYYLVLADDPKEPSRKLMGWIAEAAFGPEPGRRHEPEARGDAGRALEAKVDAGAKPAPSKRLDVKKSKDGSCPSGYAACSARCRATCKNAAECGDPAAHCASGFCLGPGTQPCK